MNTKRVHIFADKRASKPYAVLEVTSIGNKEAKVSADVDISNIKPGHILCLATGRQSDRSTDRVIAAVDQKKSGLSTITFESQPAPAPAVAKESKK